MDSRIREIEQWVAEAKTDLGECGQEEYFRKLFLLDAEIRAAIKQSGFLPEAASPQPKVQRVRRFWNPNLALSGVAGVLILAASAVYFSSRQGLAQPQPSQDTPLPRILSSSTYNPALDRGHIPAGIDGEDVLTGEMLLALAGIDTTAPATEPVTGETILANSTITAPVLTLAGGKAAPAGKAPAAAKPVGSPAAFEGGAPSVVLIADMGRTPGAAKRKTNTPTPGASSDSNAFNGTIARFAYFPEADQPAGTSSTAGNKAKDAAKKLAAGSDDNEIILDDADGTKAEDDASDKDKKLDPEALKEKFEKRFNR